MSDRPFIIACGLPPMLVEACKALGLYLPVRSVEERHLEHAQRIAAQALALEPDKAMTVGDEEAREIASGDRALDGAAADPCSAPATGGAAEAVRPARRPADEDPAAGVVAEYLGLISRLEAKIQPPS